jgi:hypothetical protein
MVQSEFNLSFLFVSYNFFIQKKSYTRFSIRSLLLARSLSRVCSLSSLPRTVKDDRYRAKFSVCARIA